VGRVVRYFTMAFLAACALFPLYWAILLSIKQPLDFFGAALVPFLTFPPTLASWQDELMYFVDEYGRLSLGRSLFTSTVVCVSSAALALVLGAPAGYALAARGRHPARAAALVLFLLPRFVLPVATIIPLFLAFRIVNLLDTHVGLVLVNCNLVLPFVVLLLRDAFRGVPAEVLEAASIDGCSAIASLWRVSLPLVAPTLLAAGALACALSWNEFLFGLVLGGPNTPTLPVAVAALDTKDGIQLEYTGSHLVLAALPPVVLMLGIQRFLPRALTFGSVAR